MARGSKKKYTSCRRSFRQMRVVLFHHTVLVNFLHVQRHSGALFLVVHAGEQVSRITVDV
jgi:hypothetical protein